MSLTKEDLQAISELLDVKISASEERTAKETTRQLNLMIEQYFDPRFSALADAIKDLHEHTVSRDELRGKLEIIEERQDAHGAILKRHEREIDLLKKAQ